MIKPPPSSIIDIAVARGVLAPCAKSKRGVVIYDPSTFYIAATGNNHQPSPFGCIGTDECKRECAKLCTHAEVDAILNALVDQARTVPLHQLVLLHVKVRDGKLVADPDDRPSCWQCSRTILEVGLAGVWLYEDRDHSTPDDFARWLTGEPERPREPKLEWRYYTAIEFHRETQINCGLPNTLKE